MRASVSGRRKWHFSVWRSDCTSRVACTPHPHQQTQARGICGSCRGSREAENVGVSKVLLDLDITYDLFLIPGLYNLFLVEAPEGEDVVGFDLYQNHIDVSKSVNYHIGHITQRTTKVKVVQVPVAGWSFPVEKVRVVRRHRMGGPHSE